MEAQKKKQIDSFYYALSVPYLSQIYGYNQKETKTDIGEDDTDFSLGLYFKIPEIQKYLVEPYSSSPKETEFIEAATKNFRKTYYKHG